MAALVLTVAAPGGFLGFLETGQTLLAIHFLTPSIALCVCIDY